MDEGTIDLLFTIECNVVNPITTEIGTQEVRVGKTHTVKTDKFELMNGVILDCEWGDGAAAVSYTHLDVYKRQMWWFWIKI